MKVVHGMITECVTLVAIKDTLLLTAKVRDLKREGVMNVISEDILPEIAQGVR